MSSISSLVPLAPFLYKRSLAKTNTALTIYIVGCLITELITTVLFFNGRGNLYLLFPFIFFQIVFLSFAINNFASSKFNLFQYSTIFAFAFILAYVGGVFYYFFRSEFSSLKDGSCIRVIEFLYLICLGVYGLHDLLSHPRKVFIDKEPLFWLCFGILLYGCGTIFYFICKSELVKELGSGAREYWSIHSVLNISFNIFLGKTVLCMRLR